MKFNQEYANQAGAQGMQTGAHVGTLEAKKLIASTGTHGVEFTLKMDGDREQKYLSVYYEKSDGTPIKGGMAVIQAIMGLCKLREVELESLAHEADVREFNGKPIGLVLQKVLYTKNNGGDGYKFEIRMPFDPKTRQTFKEMYIEKKAPEQVDALLETLTDRDDRNNGSTPAASSPNGWGQPQQPKQQYNEPPMDFDDDIPF